jgi:hypothetical protein
MTNFFDTSPAQTTETTNQTTTANPWAQASPLLTSMAQYYSGLNPAVTGQQTQAGQNLWGEANAVPSFGVQGAGAVNNLFSGLGILPSAYSTLQQNLGSVANPNNVNPYNTPGFSDALNTLTGNIRTAVKDVYGGSGRAPSGAGTFAKTLGLGLTQGEAPILQSQYNQNMANMMSANQMLQNAGINTAQAMGGDTMQALQAAGILPQVATAPGQAQLGIANTLYGQPIQNANALLSPALSLGQAGGTTTGTGTQVGTQVPAQNMFSNVLGDISGVLGIGGDLMKISSDRRLKTDIKDIGRTHDDQKIYSYRFKGSNTPQIGMLAQEVQKKTPEAVGQGPNGFKTVRYDLATRKAAQMGMLSKAA